MRGDARDEITVEPLPDGVRLVLPPRSTQGIPGFGLVTWFLPGFGLISTGVGVVVALQGDGVEMLMGAPFVLAGLLAAAVGLSIRRTRTVLEVDREQVRAVEKLGLVRLRSRRRREVVQRIGIRESGLRVNDRPVPGFGVLEVEGGGAPLRAGYLYRVELLQRVAARLGEELGLDVEAVAAAGPYEQLGAPAAEALDAPPEGSQVTLERNAAGLLMRVPPLGFRGPARTTMVFGVGFVALAVVIGVAFAAVGAQGGDGLPVWGWLVLGLFFAVGLGLGFFTVVIARRHALVAVAQGSLLIKRMSPTGVRAHEWAPGEVADVRVGFTSIEVGNRRLRELQVTATDGRPPVGLWAARDDAELEWIAAVLRDALGLSAARRAAAGPRA